MKGEWGEAEMDTNTCTVLGISMAGPLLGSLLGVSFRPKESLMYAMLSFAGGTMLAISFLEMIFNPYYANWQ